MHITYIPNIVAQNQNVFRKTGRLVARYVVYFGDKMKLHNINIHIQTYIVTKYTDDSYPWKLANTWVCSTY